MAMNSMRPSDNSEGIASVMNQDLEGTVNDAKRGSGVMMDGKKFNSNSKEEAASEEKWDDGVGGTENIKRMMDDRNGTKNDYRDDRNVGGRGEYESGIESSLSVFGSPGLRRWLSIVVDCSEGMKESDYTPNRLFYVLSQLRAFLHFFFESNPLSQAQIIRTCDSAAEIISEMSGNPEMHSQAIDRLLIGEGYGHLVKGGGRLGNRTQVAKHTGKMMSFFSGSISIGSALSLVLRSQESLVQYGRKEVLFLLGALCTQDSSSVLSTVQALRRGAVEVSVVHLAAEMHLCKVIARETGGGFYVPLNESHFLSLLKRYGLGELRGTRDQKYRVVDKEKQIRRMVLMGFPVVHERLIWRSPENQGTDKAAHVVVKQTEFACPQCWHNFVDISLPTVCPICGLTIIRANYLFRSYYQWSNSKTISALSTEEEACLFQQTSPLSLSDQQGQNNSASITVSQPPSFIRCFGCQIKLFPTPPSDPSVSSQNPDLFEFNCTNECLESFYSSQLEHWLDGSDEFSSFSRQAKPTSSIYKCSHCDAHYCYRCAKMLVSVLHLCLKCVEGGQS